MGPVSAKRVETDIAVLVAAVAPAAVYRCTHQVDGK